METGLLKSDTRRGRMDGLAYLFGHEIAHGYFVALYDKINLDNIES